MSIFKGSGVALITPFNKDLSVDYESLSKIIDFQRNNNTDAIIVCGTTGEAPTLNDDEHLNIIKF
jgi:4-hydroxy-tetrahydrodipicolinate synthase